MRSKAYESLSDDRDGRAEGFEIFRQEFSPKIFIQTHEEHASGRQAAAEVLATLERRLAEYTRTPARIVAAQRPAADFHTGGGSRVPGRASIAWRRPG